MPRVRLTDAAVKRLKQKEPGQGIEYFDANFRGFALRITPKGARSFVLFTRVHGKQRRFTLGRYPSTSLKKARKKANDILAIIDDGGDPAREQEEARRNTVEVVVEDWLKRDQSGNRGYDGVKRLFEKDVTPYWKGRPISRITRRDVNELLDIITDRGAVTHARRTYAHLHRMFRWCVGRGVLSVNPMADLEKPGQENPRDRFLNDAELARVWHAACRQGYPFGHLARLLILTGARLTEIAALRWDEVDLDGAAIRLEGERTKNGKPRVMPLSQPALDIISKTPRVRVGEGNEERDSEFVFTTNGETYSSIGSKQKRQLDTLASKRSPAGNKLKEPKPIAAWRTHDLRRTVATNMQRLGVRLEVTEAVLGHVSGSRSGVIGVYQRHDWAGETKEALEAWGRFVELITTPAGAAQARRLDGGPVERAEFQHAITQGGEAWVKYLEAANPEEHQSRTAAA